jgi:hypothetical protein
MYFNISAFDSSICRLGKRRCNSHAARFEKVAPLCPLVLILIIAQIIHFRQSLCRRLDFNHTSKASTKKGVKCESAI